MLSNSFKWKHYEGEIILLNVRWYLKCPLSYRNLKEIMIERGIEAMNTIKKGQVNDLNYSVFNEVKYINQLFGFVL